MPTSDSDAFFRTANEWVPPFSARLRQLSLLPLLAVPIVLFSTPVPWLLRLALAVGIVIIGYLILSLLAYTAMVAGAATFENVPVSEKHLGWFAEVVLDAGAQLGIAAWHFSTTRIVGSETLTPGGAALALLPTAGLPTAIVLMCHQDRASNQID